MKYSQTVKSVGYLQAHAPDMLRELSDHSPTYVITDDGEARAVMLNIRMYEELQESLALLKILAISSQHVREGKTKSAEDAFQHLRERLFQETER